MTDVGTLVLLLVVGIIAYRWGHHEGYWKGNSKGNRAAWDTIRNDIAAWYTVDPTRP
jgi:hypothetical protein